MRVGFYSFTPYDNFNNLSSIAFNKSFEPVSVPTMEEDKELDVGLKKAEETEKIDE